MSTTPNQKDLLAKKSDLEGILKPDDNDVLHLPEVTITLAESGQFYLAGIDKKLLTLIGNTSGNAVTLDGDAGLTFTTSGGSSTITGITSSSGNSTSLAASQSMASAKQDKIIAGTNITIAQDGKTISATDTNELENLTDVNITTPTDGQGLVYNNTTQKWENGTVSSASSIDTLTDVNLTNLTNGQILKYNSTSQEWENANESGGGGGSTITITPTLATGTKIADYSIDGVNGELYAPNGGSSGSSITTLFENNGTTSPASITLEDDLTNYDIVLFQLGATNGDAIFTMAYNVADLTVGDTIGAGSATSIFVWYYYTNSTTLTLRVSAGNAYMSTIVGIKLSGSGGSTGGVDTLWEGSAAPSVNNAIAVNLAHDIDDYDYILVNIKTTDQTYPYHSTCIYKPPFNINDLLLNLADGNSHLYCYLKINSLTNINLQAYDSQWGAATTYTGIYGVKTGSGSSSVIPNPQGIATDTLSTIEIDGTIYNIEGSGSGGSTFEGLDYANKISLNIPDATGYTYTPTENGALLLTGYGSASVICESTSELLHLKPYDDTYSTVWILIEKDVTYTIKKGGGSGSSFGSGSVLYFIPLKNSSSGGGGTGGGFVEDILWSGSYTPADTSASQLVTLNKNISNYDALVFHIGYSTNYSGDILFLTNNLTIGNYYTGTIADGAYLVAYWEYTSDTSVTLYRYSSNGLTPTYMKITGLKFGSGGSGGSSEITYSTTEHKVGTWIDGSDVYEKTIVLRENGTDNFTYTDYVFAQSLPANINWINIESFYAKRGSGGWVDCMNNQQETILVPNPTTQGIWFYSQMSHTDVTVTIRYTKTT